MSDKKGEGYRNEIERKSQNNLSIPKLEEEEYFSPFSPRVNFTWEYRAGIHQDSSRSIP